CPKPEGAGAVVLGCYKTTTGEIFVFDVTRPELAPMVEVTAAHEMLHAAYSRLTETERVAVDQATASYFATTSSTHLKDEVALYDRIEPGRRAEELHSLVGTEIGELPPALVTYFSRYFRDRQPVVAHYAAYVAVFDDIHRRR